MVNARAVLGLFGKGLAVVVALVVVVSAVTGGLVATGVVDAGRPTVDEYSTQWGAVTESSTGIEASVEVNNPNPVGLPGIVDVSYEMNMNDVTVAEGEKKGLGLDSGTNDIEFEAEIDNDEIADWWVTHINNGERTDVKVTATASAPFYSKTVTVKKQTIETNMLSGLGTGDNQPISVRGQRVGIIQSTQVEWGKADDETTTIKVTAKIKNTGSEPITVSDLRYSIRFNSVVMGSGTAESAHRIDPGRTKKVTFTLEIDTRKVSEWWPTHVEEDSGGGVEQTVVRTSGSVVVTFRGQSDRVGLDGLNSRDTIDTAFVEGGDEEEDN